MNSIYRKYPLVLSVLLLCCLSLCTCSKPSALDQAIAYSDKKVHLTMAQMEGVSDSMPRNILAEELASGQAQAQQWNLRANAPEEWCSGFWDGCLWYDYALTGKEDVLRAATETGERMLYLADVPIFDHDLGFLVITSLLNGYRLMQTQPTAKVGDQPSLADITARYHEALLACADSLATLFNPAVGTILSWPRNVEMFGGHNTIMDNMMNLELLFWAADEQDKLGNSEQAAYLRHIAITHADTTMTYHFREDGTCYHVAVYDPVSGKHLYNCTHQGYADESVWARGQAWAIYGYTMVYRYTHEPRFLAHAEKVTDAYIGLLEKTNGETNELTAKTAEGKEFVPLWDFCDPRGAAAPRDASAACVVMSALLELQHYTEADKAKEYQKAAMAMFDDLTQHYESAENCPALLLHSTGHHPTGSEIDAAIIYADYYFMEALYRLQHPSTFLMQL